jgi:hypothetical protein
LDDWIEGIAILSPTIQESEAAASIALRALAVVAPPAEGDESLTADELEEVGRAAQIWNLHPNEASRMAADKQFARELRAARQNSERFEALKAGVLRLKDAEIEALRANELISNRMVETSRSRADAAAERAKFQELLRSSADAERIRLK